MEHRHRRRSGLRRAGSTAVAAAGAMILVVGLSQLGTASPGTGTAQGTTAAAARPMENLGRGVVAVHSGGHDGAGTGGGRRHAGDRARPRHQRAADGPRTARPGPRAGALRRAGAASQPRPYLGMRPAGALRRPGARRRRGTARAHGRRPGHRPPPCAARADRHHRRTRRPGQRVHPLDPEPARVCAPARARRHVRAVRGRRRPGPYRRLPRPGLRTAGRRLRTGQCPSHRRPARGLRRERGSG